MNNTHRVRDALQSAEPAPAGEKSVLGSRNSLIIAQVCISFVLLMVAALMVRSFKLERVDAGDDPENVVSFSLANNFTKFAN